MSFQPVLNMINTVVFSNDDSKKVMQKFTQTITAIFRWTWLLIILVVVVLPTLIFILIVPQEDIDI
jgi:choline-glycine betaine transporter